MLTHVALTQGMAPLAFLHVAHAGLLGVMPLDVAQAFREAYIATLRSNLAIRQEQARVLQALEAGGLQVIVLKGVSLAARYYGELALRPVSDIDLLVRRQDVRDAGRVLASLGYHSSREQSRLWDVNALLNADLTYVSPHGVKLELHWELTHQPSYRAGLPVRDVQARAQVVWVHGCRQSVLSTSDELRALCVHCTADHRAERSGIRLIWLVDIAAVVHSLPSEWDWPAFVRETVRLGLAIPVLLALQAAEANFDLELPNGTLELLREAAQSPHEQEAWRLAHVRETSNAASMLAHLGALQSLGERLGLMRGILLPSPAWIRSHYPRDGAPIHALLAGYGRHGIRLFRRMITLVRPGAWWRARPR
jgi:hypothetical protein